MRKRIIDQSLQILTPADEKWLDVKHTAQVEITSEEAAFPIEEALDPASGGSLGWQASTAGMQTIRIIFDEPQQISLIHLLFKEEQQARTQEFTLQWSPDKDQPYQEIVRQQYNFSPGSTYRQEENYTVNLESVKILAITIIPDIGGGNACASMARLWLASTL